MASYGSPPRGNCSAPLALWYNVPHQMWWAASSSRHGPGTAACGASTCAGRGADARGAGLTWSFGRGTFLSSGGRSPRDGRHGRGQRFQPHSPRPGTLPGPPLVRCWAYVVCCMGQQEVPPPGRVAVERACARACGTQCLPDETRGSPGGGWGVRTAPPVRTGQWYHRRRCSGAKVRWICQAPCGAPLYWSTPLWKCTPSGSPELATGRDRGGGGGGGFNKGTKEN